MSAQNDYLTIPNGAAKYILYQRTQYLMVGKSRVTSKLLSLVPGWVYEFIVELEALLGKHRVTVAYSHDMMSEYKEIAPFLPINAKNILDIGSGLAGIDVLLNNHYQIMNSQPQFFLLDKSQKSRKVFYGFKSQGAFYNSLEMSKMLLHDNGVPLERIKLLEAVPDNQIQTEEKFDLILSLISWGFHYPVNVYIEEVKRILKEDGTLILDIRKNTQGLSELQKHFTNIRTISETQTKLRILATR